MLGGCTQTNVKVAAKRRVGYMIFFCGLPATARRHEELLKAVDALVRRKLSSFSRRRIWERTVSATRDDWPHDGAQLAQFVMRPFVSRVASISHVTSLSNPL
jgi:hypothetical protein